MPSVIRATARWLVSSVVLLFAVTILTFVLSALAPGDAAKAARRRLNDAHRERGRDRGVDGIATLAQDPRAGFRRERMLRGDHRAGRRGLGLLDVPFAARRHREDGGRLGLPVTLPPGFTVGHWTDPVGLTGCTVILCEAGATAGVHVGGGAPATIQTDVIGPASATAILHAVVLTGGSAFGLAAYDGVTRFLEEKGIGVAVRDWRVPHVAGAVIFDLAVGDAKARPNADSGYAACRMATTDPAEGLVGAGTGASVAKLGTGRAPGGLGIASLRAGEATVSAIVVVNALGDVWDGERNEWVAGAGRSVWTRVRPLAGARSGVFAAGALWALMPWGCARLWSRKGSAGCLRSRPS